MTEVVIPVAVAPTAITAPETVSASDAPKVTGISASPVIAPYADSRSRYLRNVNVAMMEIDIICQFINFYNTHKTFIGPGRISI